MNSFVDIDQCTENTDNCHNNATCENTEASFVCTCNDGFTGNGTYCEGKLEILMHTKRTW